MNRGYLVLLLILHLFVSCKTGEKNSNLRGLNYQQFKDSVIQSDNGVISDTENIFDAPCFIPGTDSLEPLLVNIDTMLRREEELIKRLDSMKSNISKEPGFTEKEKEIISENRKIVDSFLLAKKDTADKTGCREIDCPLFALIDKSKQVLYLYIFGELKDSFLVSTGKGKKYETPEMSLRPHGPLLVKYTSKKFPGGNYLGLGNMPYAVFVKGGYAIHGTTPGNFAKLGKEASHGCIRLHPDNAKVFHALVKTVGLAQTWVAIKDSLP
ncbi:MAG: L,D-transpeptidase [Chitinophagales bacterium]|nr:L,D-transpeptidase [Chitinophagales bacterium]